MRIEVTAEDIAKGKRLSACECPIALAAVRAGLVLPEAYPSGGPDDYQPGHAAELIYGGGERLVSRLPLAADRFMHRFDGRRPVEPFTFELATEAPTGGTL